MARDLPLLARAAGGAAVRIITSRPQLSSPEPATTPKRRLKTCCPGYSSSGRLGYLQFRQQAPRVSTRRFFSGICGGKPGSTALSARRSAWSSQHLVPQAQGGMLGASGSARRRDHRRQGTILRSRGGRWGATILLLLYLPDVNSRRIA